MRWLVLSCGVFHVFIIIISGQRHLVEAERLSECPSNSRELYNRCHLNFQTMSLWCDSMDWMVLPGPSHPRIITQTNASRTERIYINGSCLMDIDRNVIRQYPYLIGLNCDNNRLTSIHSQTFSVNTHIETLTLSNNKISVIEDKAFEGLTKLKQMSLRGNMLTEIHVEMFQLLSGILTLDLSGNRLLSIDEGVFLDLSNLEELNLSENNLRSINAFHLNGLFNLRRLYLQANNIANVGSKLFFSSPHIMYVDLSNNNISCLPKNIFHDRGDAEVFRINNNVLTTLRQEWFRNVHYKKKRSLIGLNLLSGNQWSCDCSSHGYWNFLRDEVRRSWRSLLDVVCSSPPHRKGRVLSSLAPSVYKQCVVSGDEWDGCKDPSFYHPLMAELTEAAHPSHSIPTTTQPNIDSAADSIHARDANIRLSPSSSQEESGIFLRYYWIFVVIFVALVLVVAVATIGILWQNRQIKANCESKKKQKQLTNDDSADGAYDVKSEEIRCRRVDSRSFCNSPTELAVPLTVLDQDSKRSRDRCKVTLSVGGHPVYHRYNGIA